MTITEIISKHFPRAKKTANGYVNRCPAHDDKTPSLSISEGTDGRTLLHCFKECSVESIVSAVGLEMKDLFVEGYPSIAHNNGDGWKNPPKKIVAVYPYTDADGVLLYENVRYEPKGFGHRRPDGSDGYIDNLNGIERVPYRLQELTEAMKRPDPEVWLTEGEKDADNLRSLGLPATSFKNWTQSFNKYIKDAYVVLFRDHDVSGEKQANGKAGIISEVAKSIKMIDPFEGEPLPEKHGKDVSDWIDARRSEGLHNNDIAEMLTVWVERADTWSADAFTAENFVAGPAPAAAVVELLDEPPEIMTRPLQIIDGRAHAATWLYTKTTRTESFKGDKIIRHNPPIETTERQLFILRDDGVLFGNGLENDLSELEFGILLGESLQDRVCMAKAAVEQFRANRSPNIVNLFNELVSLFDLFLDFDGSLADQKTVCEMSACFAIATWFLEAFNAAGYIYPTGGRGAGKTQYLSLMCSVAYLGEMIQASGSFASIRDLSNYGAFLGFDDAENVTSKSFDPDKRNILLSGTKRGSQITVKEPMSGGRGWVTKYVNTFAFRGFSAIRSPDPTLGSRTITVPLIRTADKAKGDSDPLEFDLWPRHPKAIRADAWQIALKHLVEMQTFDRKAKARATITGRNLEPWTGILAVAAFLDEKTESPGLTDDEGRSLFHRMNELAASYQQDRADLEAGDLTRLVLRALVFCISPNATEPFVLTEIASDKKEWVVTTAEVTEKSHDLIKAEELDFDVETINSRRVGRALGRLRIPKRSDGTKRRWGIQAASLEKQLKSYSLLDVSEKHLTHDSITNVSNVNNVNNVNSADVSDVSYITYVSKPNGDGVNQHTAANPAEPDVTPHPINVNTVRNVNDVKTDDSISPALLSTEGEEGEAIQTEERGQLRKKQTSNVFDLLEGKNLKKFEVEQGADHARPA